MDFLKRARTADLDPSMLKFINERITPRGVGYLDGTVDKFLEIHDDHTHVLTSTNKMRRIYNDQIIARKFENTEVLHEKLQCVHQVDAPLAYEAVPKSQSFAIAAGVRIMTTASMMDKEGETVPNGKIATVISFTKLCGHIHFVQIQFDGSQKNPTFWTPQPKWNQCLHVQLPTSVCTHIPSSPRKNYEWSHTGHSKCSLAPSIRESAEYEMHLVSFFNCKISENLKND